MTSARPSIPEYRGWCLLLNYSKHSTTLKKKSNPV